MLIGGVCITVGVHVCVGWGGGGQWMGGPVYIGMVCMAVWESAGRFSLFIIIKCPSL